MLKNFLFILAGVIIIACDSTPPATPTPFCGDGTLDAGEQCDDGNTLSGDGCNDVCRHEIRAIPPHQFHIGDSIGEGEAADGTIGEPHPDQVWATGYTSTDIVYSLNERFADLDPLGYSENAATQNSIYNKAISGAAMVDFASQAALVVTEAEVVGEAGMVTILLGNNDVCADNLGEMTAPDLFEQYYRTGLDVLTASQTTQKANIHISGLPDIYWLWIAKKENFGCSLIWRIGNVCQALLQNPGDDCQSMASRDDPDYIYSNDGPNCRRRKEFHRRIREEYNRILRDVIEEYRADGRLPNAYYVDMFDIHFTNAEINDGDCFHPSTAGHELLAEEAWCRSPWGADDPLCIP